MSNCWLPNVNICLHVTIKSYEKNNQAKGNTVRRKYSEYLFFFVHFTVLTNAFHLDMLGF